MTEAAPMGIGRWSKRGGEKNNQKSEKGWDETASDRQWKQTFPDEADRGGAEETETMIHTEKDRWDGWRPRKTDGQAAGLDKPREDRAQLASES